MVTGLAASLLFVLVRSKTRENEALKGQVEVVEKKYEIQEKQQEAKEKILEEEEKEIQNKLQVIGSNTIADVKEKPSAISLDDFNKL